MIHIYNPNAIEPPDEEWLGVCPNCGTPLNYDDDVYLADIDNSVIGCQYCITKRSAEFIFDD